MVKRLGIIGGMGPKATAIFFDKIIENTVAEHDHEHIESVILNSCKLQEKSGGMFPELELLLGEVKKLESLNVDLIAMPCNTAHIHHERMKKHTNVEIINMIDETAKYIKNLAKGNSATVGILATNTTIKTELYTNALISQGFRALEPDTELQSKIMSIIYDQVKKTGHGELRDFLHIIDQLRKQGADYIIIGCTELSYFSSNYALPEFCIDAMNVLVETVIKKSGRRVRCGRL